MKKLIVTILYFAFCLNFISHATSINDNDGSAFITKAEFDALKSSFQSQIDEYNTNIDSKIDNAIASYLSGIKISTEADNPFFNGLGSKVLVCDTSKINNIKRGRAKLDYLITTGHVPENYYEPMAGIAMNMKRDSKKTFEMFMVDSNKFRYVDNATLSFKATAASGLLRTGRSAVTYADTTVRMRWHASPWASGTNMQKYNRKKEVQGWYYWSDRLDDFNYYQWYGTDFNFGFAGEDDTSYIFGTVTASTDWSAPAGNEINFCFDTATSATQVWVKGPNLIPSDIIANTLTNYENLTTGTDRYYYSDPTTAGVTTTGNGVRHGGNWNVQTFTNPIWVTYGDYSSKSTSITGGTGGWYEPAPNLYSINPSTIKNDVGDSVISQYSSYGYTGSIVQGVPIGLFDSDCTIDFTIDTTSLGRNAVLALNGVPFNQTYKLEDTPITTDVDIYIDGTKLTSTGSKVISAGSHTVKLEIKASTATQKPIFIKLGWEKTYTGTDRKLFTLPTTYHIKTENV